MTRDTDSPTRRALLKGGAVLATSVSAVWGMRSVAQAATTPTASSEAALAAATSCPTVTQEETQGPFWIDERLNRSDIRYDTGVKSTSTTTPVSGVPLTLTVTLTNTSTCAAEAGAYVDIWHADAAGVYSDVSGSGNPDETGHNFLRGYQVTDANGQVTFTTVYPGWYVSRTIHIHMRVRTSLGSDTEINFTTQIFFDDTTSDTVQARTDLGYKGASGRDTRNSTDGLYDASLLAGLSGDTTNGYSAMFTAALDFGDGTSTTGSSDDQKVTARVGGVSVLTRRGRRLLKVGLNPKEVVAAKVRLLDDDDVLAKRTTGWLPARRRAVGLVVPNSVRAGDYHVQVTLADKAGNKKIVRRLVHIPRR